MNKQEIGAAPQGWPASWLRRDPFEPARKSMINYVKYTEQAWRLDEYRVCVKGLLLLVRDRQRQTRSGTEAERWERCSPCDIMCLTPKRVTQLTSRLRVHRVDKGCRLSGRAKQSALLSAHHVIVAHPFILRKMTGGYPTQRREILEAETGQCHCSARSC